MGNPLRLFDPDGSAPFDPFPDEETAMLDFAMKYNLSSGIRGREFATVPINITGTDGKPAVSYVPPLEFSDRNADPNYVRTFYENQKINNILKIDFTWRNSDNHTHGDGAPAIGIEGNKIFTLANSFSPGDIRHSIEDCRVNSYLSTPGGKLWQFEVNKGNFNLISDKIPKYEGEWNRNNMVKRIQSIEDPNPLPLYIRKMNPKTGKERFVKVPDIREMPYDTDPKNP